MAHLKLSMSNVKWDDKGETYCWSVLKYVFKTSEINYSWIFNESH